jgi:hypothetical protein
MLRALRLLAIVLIVAIALFAVIGFANDRALGGAGFYAGLDVLLKRAREVREAASPDYQREALAFRGLAPDEQALVTVGVVSDRPVSHIPVRLDAGDGLTVATPAPRVAALPSGGPVASLAIDYPRARSEFAGLSSTSWIFFGAVMVIA